MAYTLQFGKSTTLAAELAAAEVSSGTLTTAAFGSPTEKQLLVLGYDTAAPEVIECVITGTALSTITREKDDTHASTWPAGTKVGMMFVPSHYEDLKTITSSDGWTSITEVFTIGTPTTYNTGTGNTPVYDCTFTLVGDYTTKYQVGMRLKFTKGSVKYGIISKVAYAGGTTTITVFLGTDYAMTGLTGTISSVYYSHEHSPFGFPVSPLKWSTEITVSTASESTPGTQNVWYNHTSIAFPVGVWKTFYKARYSLNNGGGTGAGQITLSTGNSTESDADMTTGWGGYAFATASYKPGSTLTMEKFLTIASNATHYLNYRWTVSSGGVSTQGIYGNIENTIIRAVCAYL